MRNDIDQLWENYLVTERLKKQSYQRIYANNYYWRTYNQQEIDWIEEREGELHGFEFKWGAKTASAPSDWIKAYKNGSFTVINQENYFEFIT